MQPLEQTYNLGDYVAAVKRRSRLFFKVAIPIGLIGIAIALTLPDLFRSTSRIAVNLEGANVQTLEPIQVAAYADQYIAQLRDRVLATRSLEVFARDSKVFGLSEEEMPIPDRIASLRQGFFFFLDTQPVISDSGREVDVISGFHVGFEGYDPEFSANAARFFSSSFLSEDRKRGTEKASSTSAFLAEQIGSTEQEIVQLEQQVADFKVRNACCLPELKEINLGTIQRAERDIEALRPRIRTLTQDRNFVQRQIDEIRQGVASADRLAELEDEYIRLVANYGSDHPDVGRVRRQIEALTSAQFDPDASIELQSLRLELAEAERKYSDIHPDVVRLKRRIATLEQGIPGRSSTDRLVDNPRYLQLRAELNAIDTELTELRTREPELRGKIEEYEDRLKRTPQIETEYLALSRKLETASENYNNLQERLVIARQTEALESTDIGTRLSEVQAASVPRGPSGPPRAAISIVGLFLAVTFGAGTIILAEMLDSRVRSSKDVIGILDVIPIAVIPVIDNSVSKAASMRQSVIMFSVTAVVLIVLTFFIVRTMA